MIYELEITLKDVGSPVSRTVQIKSDSTFFQLHMLIQAAFNWTNSHLYGFDVQQTNGETNEQVYISPAEAVELGFTETDDYKDNEEVLSDWFIERNDTIIYFYDFGDNWEHEIIFVNKQPGEADVTYPRCTKAVNLAPPEDSRGEVIMGEIDLEYSDSTSLVKEANDLIEAWNSEGDYEDEDIETVFEIDYWPVTLQKAKEFQQLKPWETIRDEHIFAIKDPDSGKLLFCSIIGHAGEMCGLAIYIGMDGFFALLETLTSERDEFEILQRQHSLLVSFEDRTDLEKEEYELIKTYDTPFRGKKAWPSFVSFVPGYLPWHMENEEARLMHLGLEETIKVYEHIQNGLELPGFLEEEKILVRALHDDKFQNFVVDIEDIITYETEIELTISELELKRVSKIKKLLPVTIEFTLTYVNIPVEVEEGGRPIFPLTITVADHDEEIILHHELYEHPLNPSIAQREFINVFHNLNGIPKNILMDERTYYYVEPLLDELHVNVELVEELPVINAILDGLQGYFDQHED